MWRRGKRNFVSGQRDDRGVSEIRVERRKRKKVVDGATTSADRFDPAAVKKRMNSAMQNRVSTHDDRISDRRVKRRGWGERRRKGVKRMDELIKHNRVKRRARPSSATAT